MPKVPDTDLQARLLRESLELSKKKRKLEEDLRTADVRHQLLMDSAARRDIEAYNKRPL